MIAAGSDVRWGLTPASESGPDDRVSIMHQAVSGATVEDYIAVRNLGTSDAMFTLRSGDGFFTANGRFDMVSSSQESVGSGTWISVQPTVAVPAGQTTIVPFTLMVPSTAVPGDHAAGITASITRADAQNPQLTVESRVGVRVTTRVIGEISPKLAATAEAYYSSGWNPFGPGTVTVDVTAANHGNVRLFVTGNVSAGTSQSLLSANPDEQHELLPQDSQVIPVTLNRVWPWFRVTGHAQLYPTMLAADGTIVDLAPVTIPVSTTAFPWPQLALFTGITLLTGVAAWGRTRSKKRTAALIELARKQGRAEAAAAPESGAPQATELQ